MAPTKTPWEKSIAAIRIALSYFQIFIYRNGEPQKIPGLKDIVISNLKIKKETDLTRKDIEYELLRFFDVRDT